MATTIENSYVGDGSTVLYSFTFPYIEETDVKVSLDDVDTTAYSFANATTIELDAAPTAGTVIRIYRLTDYDNIRNIFYPGSAVRSKDLNDNFTQSLFVVQEAAIDSSDARSDAAQALDTAQTAEANSAAAEASAAQASADAAQAAEDAAQAQAVQVSLTPVYNIPGDDQSGISHVEAQAPIDAKAGMELPDETAPWATEGSMRYNTITQRLEKYNGIEWVNAAGGSVISETPPTPAVNGDVWYEPTSGRSYVYYTDVDSAQWVEMNPSWNGSIANSSVTTDKIQDSAVTPAKLDRTYVEPGQNVSLLTNDAGYLTSSTGVDVSGDTMTGNLTVPSLNGGQIAGFRNQLINGDFRVWQRGTTTADFTFAVSTPASDRYIADRWFQNQDSTASSARRVGPGGDLPPGYAYALLMSTFDQLCQAIELPDIGTPGPFALNSQWTLSYWCNQAGSIATESPSVQFRQTSVAAGSVSVTTSAFGAPIETVVVGGQTWSRFASTFTIDASPTASHDQLRIGFSNGAAGGRITGCQLEPGPVATPFEHRPLSAELALSQRYYQIGRLVWQNYASSTGATTHTVLLPNVMRTVSATVSTSSTSGGTISTARLLQGYGKYPSTLQLSTSNTGAGSQVATDYNIDAEL